MRSKGKLCQVNTRSVTVGLSALAHLAAIGVLLAFRPAPYPDPAPTFEAVEVSIVPDATPDGRPNEPSGNNPGASPGNVSTVPFPSLTRWDATATGQPSDRPDVPRGAFGLPAQPTFKSPAPGLDMLGTMLDCQAVEGREASRRPLHPHPPCAYADLALRAPVTKFQTDVPGSTDGAWADEAHRTFKTIQPLFDESLFPEKVPQANRVLRQWITGLFR
jgi:hypothetical protein